MEKGNLIKKMCNGRARRENDRIRRIVIGERIAAIALVRTHEYVRNSGSSSRSIEGEERSKAPLSHAAPRVVSCGRNASMVTIRSHLKLSERNSNSRNRALRRPPSREGLHTRSLPVAPRTRSSMIDKQLGNLINIARRNIENHRPI